MQRNAVAALACSITLAACAVPGQGPGGATTPNQAAAPASPAFATQLAGPSTFLGPMPTAVVVLKPDDLNRNRAFCNAFASRMPTARQALAGSVIAPNLVLTRWLVQLPEIPPERASDCDFLVGAYDYARASRLLGALRLSEGQLSGPGPFLIVVIPGNAGLHVAGLNGSGYGAADFGGFVDAWGQAFRQTQAEVSRAPDQPGLVRSLVNLAAATLRTAAGGAAGLIRGVATTL